MKPWLIGALVMALVATAAPTTADAKRIGGGKSSGLQRNMPARTAPDAPPPKPATPAQGQQATPATGAAAAAAPAAAPRRNWMGPLAGLAAGLGIAALLSHFGMGEGAANFLMMALLAVGAFFLIRFLLRRFAGGGAARMPALAGAGAGASGNGAGGLGSIFGGGARPADTATSLRTAQTDGAHRSGFDRGPVTTTTTTPTTPTNLESAGSERALAPSADVPVSADQGITRAFVPAAFDAESFTRTAKMIFIRLQAANDTADLDDLRRFTTPELFASLRLDIQERGPSAQHTDVVQVEADVLDVANETDRQVVSVRFHGKVVEEKGSEPVAFDEVWHLAKPHDDSRAWAIAGIEQMA